MNKPKFEIPTHDPYTGDLNPHYEELTGKPNPLKQEFVLALCEHCIQMTNHLDGVCQKCKKA